MVVRTGVIAVLAAALFATTSVARASEPNDGFSVFLADQMTPADYVALSTVAAATVTAG
jgi:hypothetical protein